MDATSEVHPRVVIANTEEKSITTSSVESDTHISNLVSTRVQTDADSFVDYLMSFIGLLEEQLQGDHEEVIHRLRIQEPQVHKVGSI